MITTVSCSLSLQLTRKLVNLSTRQLQIMITDVSCSLSLQLTCLLVHLSTRSYVTMSSLQATCSLVYSLTCLLVNLSTCQLQKIIRVIREIRSSKFKVFKF